MVSHRSAAVLWGISGFRPGRLEITVPAGRSNRNALAHGRGPFRSDRLRRNRIEAAGWRLLEAAPRTSVRW